MKKALLFVLSFMLVTALFGLDSIILSHRRVIEGTIKGASSANVYITDKDGIFLAIPKGLIKSAYSGNKDITTSLMFAEGSDVLTPNLKQKAAPDSTKFIRDDSVVNALHNIDNKLTMIAIPIWISIIVGFAAILLY